MTHDHILNKHLIETFQTSDFYNPGDSQHIDDATTLAEWGLRIAREDYDEHQDRLKLLFSPSHVNNALAVWGNSRDDWIVLSNGLLLALQGHANRSAGQLSSNLVWLLETPLYKSIEEAGCIHGLDTPFASFLYFAGLNFLTGHEAGHHVLGHDGFYRSGFHVEILETEESTQETEANFVKQALEFQADRYGIMVARRSMVKWLAGQVASREYSEQEQRSYQFLIALFMYLGALAALAVIKPGRIEWKTMSTRKHPFSVLRMLSLMSELTNAIKKHFIHLKDDQAMVHAIQQEALELVAIGMLSSDEHDENRELGMRRRHVALRKIGLFQAINDTNVGPYIERLRAAEGEMLHLLTPRSSKFRL